MKRFAWVQVAVQALAIDGKGGHEVPKRGKTRNEVYIKDIEVPIPTPIWAENARARSEADLQEAAEVQSLVEVVWNNPAPSREPPSIPRMVTSDELADRNAIRSVTTTAYKKRRSSLHWKKEKEEEVSFDSEYNPGVTQYVTDGYFQDSRSLKRRNGSTSTLFQNSPLAPVTIILTTPEDDEFQSPPPTPSPEPRNSFNSIRASRTGNPNASTTSLPATRFSRRFSTDSLPLPQSKRLDPNKLMPPTEGQIDSRRSRKAQEFREIRKFLIHFMNAKGDQFPKKLRSRMMEAYAISDKDLSPEVVARFNDADGDIKDEGVALERLGMNELDKEATDAENLRILSLAFRSQIPVVTPTREATCVDTIPPYINKNPIRPRQTSVSKPAPPIPAKSPARIAEPARPPISHSNTQAPSKSKRKTEDEEQLSLTWLGPLISTSPADWSLPLDDPSERGRLQKAQSQPNLSRRPTSPPPALPPLNSSIYSSSSKQAQSKRARNNSLGGVEVEKALHVARVKRQGIIAGAFGAVREAMGGKKAGVAGEKRRLMREHAGKS